MRSLLLVLVALLSFVGQEAALANVAPIMLEQTHASEMSSDCAEMMGQVQAPTPKKKPPCSGSMECMMAMGCLPSMLPQGVEAQAAEPLIGTTEQFWPRTAVLVGGDLEPEPDPPTYLA